MSKKAMLSAAMAAVLVSGCASTRGGQNIACEGFGDFALEPGPHAIIRDIQRYGVENRGASHDPAIRAGQDAANGPVDAMIGEAVFGMDDAALKQEAKRLRSLYDAAGARAAETGGAKASGASASVSQDTILVSSTLSARNVLLLSGGGQWGAYGAGLMLGMVCTAQVDPGYDRTAIPCLIKTPGRRRVIESAQIDFKPLDDMDIGIITGVSTGSLQSLLLMVILDKTQLRSTRLAALQQMLDSYAPEKQSELVDYDGFRAVVFQGSVAGTDALRNRVKEVLEKRWGFRDGVIDADGRYSGDPVATRRLVDQLAFSPITTMVGVVEGRDGDFKSVNMKRMVREIQPDDGDGRHEQSSRATNCVLAATLASSAMPVFHQQVRVVARDQDGDSAPGTTLFDGGVRRSVFISELGNAFKRRYAMLATYMGRELYAMADKQGKLPRIYVLRNGPTTSVFNEDVNAVESAIGQALRAYELLVNELEVGSIAALRLANPHGPIELSTADGSEDPEFTRRRADGSAQIGPRRPGCIKNGEMFDPAFMVCLQNFGIRRGMSLEVDRNGEPIPPFWTISTIDPPPAIAVPEATNDN